MARRQIIKKTCNADSLNKMIDSDNITLVVGTQVGCPACPPWIEKLKKNPPPGVAIVEIPSENGRPVCEDLQRNLKVKYTPQTMIYHRGKKVETFKPDESGSVAKNYRMLRQEISKVASKKS